MFKVLRIVIYDMMGRIAIIKKEDLNIMKSANRVTTDTNMTVQTA
jgi:hypothetical protein